MARATVCAFEGQQIGIDEALQLPDQGDLRPDFRCIECAAPVRAHKEGGGAQAHFEHLSRNPDCRLSDPGR